MKPIFHLSFPVRDLDEAVDFYVRELGAVTGRREAGFADLSLFGAQITLQNDPPQVATRTSRSRHFGATLAWDEWKELAYRLKEARFRVEGPRMDYCFTPREQAKIMIADPSGNLIELKTYKNPAEVLGSIYS